YLNATFIAENQAYTVLNDWAGGDGTGLGRVNGSANIGNTTNFEGDIAIVRFYEKALTETEVQGNFNAINGGVE
ncbi:MAG: hypothetical protein GY821_09485, partial [Gammaproteobacteria bacterium]|nr:hypothetical protein [Gammaproteobacteria bacterium]